MCAFFFCFFFYRRAKASAKRARSDRHARRGKAFHALFALALVSLAAVFWMTRNAPPKELGERYVTSKKQLRGRLHLPFALSFIAGYSFIVELHLLIKGYHLEKEKSGFTFFCVCVKQTFFVHGRNISRICQFFFYVFLSRQV